MNTRKLGNSDLMITPIGFGAWAAGGPWQFGWGEQSDRDSTAAIQRALEFGINWLDTALRDWAGQRPYVFTKCGMVWNEQGEIGYCLRPKSIRRECEASLRRLNIDVIDLYQIHWPADDLVETLEGWAAMGDLQREGKVRWIGVSNFSLQELQRANGIAPITSLQPPYSLVRRDAEKELLPFCERENIGVIVYSPMASGLLTGAMTRDRLANLPADDWRKGNPDFQEPRFSKNLALVERLRTVGARHGKSPGELAIAWTLRHSAVTGAIVGARNAKQIDGIIDAATFRLTQDEIREIETEG
jgi:aryl-alcohol dehydrogenase-like predicted oxidoreductase